MPLRRFALATLRDRGILLDLASGEFFRVEASALFVSRALVAGKSPEEAARALAGRYGLSVRGARRDVDAFLAALRPSRRGRSAPGVRFRDIAGGYAMHVGRESVLRVAADGHLVERACVLPASLRLAAPHVLALRGVSVLHASTVQHRRGVVAFVGPSGVGKSTLARLCARSGRKVVGEDLLVLDGVTRALVDGERAIRAWSRRRALRLEASPIEGAARATAPLTAVLLVERAKGAKGLVVERLDAVDGVAELFQNAFIELPNRRVWRDALAVSRALVARGIVRRLRVPDGITALCAAVPAFVRQTSTTLS